MLCRPRSVVLGLCGTLVLAAQASELTPTDLLLKIRARALENLNRQPNYTCTETIERSQRLKATHKYQMLDTIRLEVALVDGKEMFAWPGSTKFEDRKPGDFIREGAIGNGSFGLYARAIFSGVVSRFIYEGTGTTGDRAWVRFSYSVPRELSGNSIKNNNQEAIVAFHGTFEADPKTFDLQRIEVIADEIPARLLLDKVVSTVTYARSKIGAGDFLLPSESELAMFDTGGAEQKNRLRFVSCRQFAGESVIRFDAALDSTPDTAIGPDAEIVLPAGLVLTLSLIGDVVLANAATGDPVKARLQNDLKSKSRVLMPKGAIASGRITRIERRSEVTIVGVTFDELRTEGVRAHPQLRLEEVASADHIPPRGRYISASLRPGEGVIPLGTGHNKLNRGLLMNWSTEIPKPE